MPDNASLSAPQIEPDFSECDLPNFRIEPVHGRGVFVTAVGGRIVRWNPQAAVLMGLEQGLLDSGTTISDVLGAVEPLLSNPEAAERIRNLLSSDSQAAFEEVFVFRGDQERYVHVFSTPLAGEDGESRERVFVISDITMRRQLEASVQRAYAELKNAQDLLVQSEKLRAIGQIASGVAHDFNNILGIILGNIQLLKSEERDENVQAKLARAERAALDGIETVRRIQEFTRQQAPRQTEVIDLGEMAQELAETMRPVYEQHAVSAGAGIQVRVEADEGAFTVGSSAEIRQVLTNIFLNAVQAMPEGGTITLRAGRENASSWISITDTGVGMSQEVCRRVFEPFFTTRGVEGTGLGLSVAYGIVRRHDGSIRIVSEPGKGTTVTVYLPYSRPAAGGTAQQEQTRKKTKPARILVVDDEVLFAQVVAEMLNEQGHEAIYVNSGAAAVEALRKNSFDVIFTDLGMPGMSGREVAREARRLAPNARVVLLTGWDNVAAGRDDEDDAPVDLVLTKPLKMEQIPSTLSRLLDEREEA
ncbi:MAG: hybrid sensor histidine kinase/response regulator [Armatimonadota bacterium]